MEISEQNQNEYQKQIFGFLKLFKTSIGYISYGYPTVQEQIIIDNIKEMPKYFILPKNMFNKENGMFIGELERPIWYNYKEKGIKTTIICQEDQVEGFVSYLHQCFIGNEIDSTIYSREFHNSFDEQGIPEFKKESQIIQKSLLNITPIEEVEQLIDFKIINQDNQTVQINDDVEITKIDKNNLEIIDQQQLRHSINYIEIEYQIREKINEYLDQFYCNFEEIYENIKTNDFGVMGLYSPFDPQTQTGYFFWVNGRIIIVDPPIYTTRYFKAIQIPQSLIDWVILTHTHTQNDIGLLQCLIKQQRLEIITTPLILSSFIQKYSISSNIDQIIMRRLFKFKPVVIGAGINLNGCIIRFHYAFHQIPTLGFEITNQNKSIYYSGHTYYDPKFFAALAKAKMITQKRYEFLANIKFIHNIILFNGENSYASTNIRVINCLPIEIQKNIYLTNLSQKQLSQINFNQENNQTINKQNQQILTNSVVSQQLIKGFEITYANNMQKGINSVLSLEITKHKVMEYMQKLEILSSIDVFEGLTIKNVRDLIDVSSEENFSKGQIVIKQNTKGSKWYIILQGKIQVKNQFIDLTFQDGEYFGETALRDDNSGLRMADCIAKTDVSLLTLEKQDFYFVFGQGPESMGRKILEKQAKLGKARQQKAQVQINLNSFFKDYLNNAQMTQLQMIMQLQVVQQGYQVWKIEERSSIAVLVKSGQLKFTESEEEQQNIIFREGSFIGEINAIIEDTEHTTTLEVITEQAEFWIIQKVDLLLFMRRNPGLFLAFGDAKFFI